MLRNIIAKTIMALVGKTPAEELVAQKNFHFSVAERKSLWVWAWSYRWLSLTWSVKQLYHCMSEVSLMHAELCEGGVFKLYLYSSQGAWLWTETHPPESYYWRCCPHTMVFARTAKALTLEDKGYQKISLTMELGVADSTTAQKSTENYDSQRCQDWCSEHKSQAPIRLNILSLTVIIFTVLWIK